MLSIPNGTITMTIDDFNMIPFAFTSNLIFWEEWYLYPYPNGYVIPINYDFDLNDWITDRNISFNPKKWDELTKSAFMIEMHNFLLEKYK